ncbi:sensor histidine kinase [uncultured Serinicoccus sp.]|uniref:sensor histidine kinase n=1 Tax=uncultured Serinicoccus sp. TaxID=735514 RepID=UPI00261C4122|nr:histidine kinase [uncultured Serinicoccus sp.]
MSPRKSGTDAWGRWGWLFGAIWLVFFAFPVTYIWTADGSMVWRLAATAVVAAFMVAYVMTVRLSTHLVSAGEYARAARGGRVGLVAMVATALVLAALIGPNALTAFPFIVAVPVFFLPWRAMWTTSVTLFAVGVVSSTVAWGLSRTVMFWGIALLVLATSVLSRHLEERQESAREVEGQLALTEERERVARDVHDVLGHSLTVVTVKTELAQRLIDVDPQAAKQELAEVQDLSRQALAEIRATVGGLRVARLADELEAARVALAGAGIEIEVCGSVTDVDPRHRITLAWVLREAVTNVVRHSGASRCTVELGESSLRVVDDGVGGGVVEGNGLCGAGERVRQAGGQLSLGAGRHGAGTALEVRW